MHACSEQGVYCVFFTIKKKKKDFVNDKKSRCWPETPYEVENVSDMVWGEENLNRNSTEGH